AMDQARFQVHDPVGVLEVARQAGIGTLQHARAHAQIAFLERNIGRTLRLLPQLLAAELEQLDRAALGDHLLVLLDFLLFVLCGGRQGDDQQNAGKAQHQATTPSILLVSPLLSSQPTRSRAKSPDAAPCLRSADRGAASGDYALDLVGLALVVEPADLDLVALGAALDAKREHRIARHRLADLALDHGLAVLLHADVLDEV